MDRKVGHAEMLMIQPFLQNDCKEKDEIVKLLIKCLEEIALINRCQAINIGINAMSKKLAIELQYWKVIKKNN